MVMVPRPAATAYQMIPASTAASDRRSTTESRNAPRRETRPEALATAPSSMSGRPERRLTAPPMAGRPVAIRAPAPRLPARPMPVRLLAVMPALARAWPAGSVTWRKVSRALDESTGLPVGDGDAPWGERPWLNLGRLALLTDPAQRRPVTAICGGSIAATWRHRGRLAACEELSHRSCPQHPDRWSRGSRQDLSGRGGVPRHRGHQPHRPGRGRYHRHRLRARGDTQADLGLAGR